MKIEIDGTTSPQNSFDLESLAEQFRNADIVAELIGDEFRDGVRDGGLTLGISIASLTVAAASSFISILAYWRSTRPKYSVTVTNGNVTVAAGDLSSKAAHETIKALMENTPIPDLDISIRENGN